MAQHTLLITKGLASSQIVMLDAVKIGSRRRELGFHRSRETLPLEHLSDVSAPKAFRAHHLLPLSIGSNKRLAMATDAKERVRQASQRCASTDKTAIAEEEKHGRPSAPLGFSMTPARNTKVPCRLSVQLVWKLCRKLRLAC